MSRTRVFALVALAVQFFCSRPLSAQDVDSQPVTSAQAQQLLKALIPPKKKFVVVNAYVAGTHVKDVNLGMSCSSSSSSSTSGTVDDDGNIHAQTQGGGSSSCREVHHYYRTMFLGFADTSDPQAGYLLTAQCVEKWIWNHCDMPPEKSTYPVVLEIGKHDSFSIYAATAQKLGGKQKVAKFAVLDLSHVKQKDNQAANLVEK
jgi:hypothetical protein